MLCTKAIYCSKTSAPEPLRGSGISLRCYVKAFAFTTLCIKVMNRFSLYFHSEFGIIEGGMSNVFF